MPLPAVCLIPNLSSWQAQPNELVTNMRSSVQIAISLTLLMLLLVALAAIFFLFNNQARLVGERDQAIDDTRALNATSSALQIDLQSAAGTRQVQETRVVELENDNQTLDSQLVESGMTATAQAVEVTRMSETLNTTQAQAPIVNIISPSDGTVVDIGQEVTILISASDPAGVTQVEAGIDSQPFANPATGDTTATLNTTWTPNQSGTFVLQASATNANGVASEPMSIAVTVAEPTATPTPTATPSPAPTQGSTPSSGGG